MRLTLSIAAEGATDDDLKLLRHALISMTKSTAVYDRLMRKGNAGVHVQDIETKRTVTINTTKEGR